MRAAKPQQSLSDGTCLPTAFGTHFLLPSWEASGQTNGVQSEIAKGESQCQRDKFLMGHAVALSGTL